MYQKPLGHLPTTALPNLQVIKLLYTFKFLAHLFPGYSSWPQSLFVSILGKGSIFRNSRDLVPFSIFKTLLWVLIVPSGWSWTPYQHLQSPFLPGSNPSTHTWASHTTCASKWPWRHMDSMEQPWGRHFLTFRYSMIPSLCLKMAYGLLEGGLHWSLPSFGFCFVRLFLKLPFPQLCSIFFNCTDLTLFDSGFNNCTLPYPLL